MVIKFKREHKSFQDRALGSNQWEIYNIVKERKEITLDELEDIIRENLHRFSFTLWRSPMAQTMVVIKSLAKYGYVEIIEC